MSMNKRRTFAVIGKNIIKKMSNKTILDDLNITVEKQSIYAVLGENGSGKSVLLRCLSGILEQDGGEVIMMADDNPVASGSSGVVGSPGGSGVIGAEGQTIARRRQPKIGFAPQDFDMPGPMRIYHLLYFIGAVNGLIVDQIVEKYKAIVPMTGLPPTTKFLVDQLRLSQKKVLSLVLAILHDPEVIILDDITTGMDSVTLKKSSMNPKNEKEFYMH
ncbi:ABC transporter G family member 20-like isoform X2 [Myzus persicae]|uniref:ABC transporter G family member 20-like isoform X2 n=1 Tax=Myzus persicae TaxID=13164 RepID=UPI000B930EE3|nr:ABC transporter G family member 20-like isoform X2 [Myzus persicae]